MKNFFSLLILLFFAGEIIAQNWLTTGNAGTNPAINFIGTTDNTNLRFRTNNLVRMSIRSNGNVGIGISNPTSLLHVNGVIAASGGTSDNWNAAYGWGNHALAGYLAAESDPQVGTLSSNEVPRWSGTSLTSGSIYDNGSRVIIGAVNSVGRKFQVTDSTWYQTGAFVNYYNPAGYIIFPSYAVWGESNNTSSNGKYGGYFWAHGTAGSNFGVAGIANGIGATTNIGVYGAAENATDNYAAYFDGRSYFGDFVGIGTEFPNSLLHINGATSEPPLRVQISGSSKLTVATNGGVSIGTFNDTPPDDGLFVAGPAFFNTSIAEAGVDLKVYGTDVVQVIDGIDPYIQLRDTAFDVGFLRAIDGDLQLGTNATNDNGNLVFRTDGVNRMYIDADGSVSIGTTETATGYMVSVNGRIICEELRVELDSAWPDYVFDEKYDLMSIDEFEEFITKNKHLPGIPDQRKVKEEGQHVGEMQTLLLEKIEELSLYIIELENRIDDLEKISGQ